MDYKALKVGQRVKCPADRGDPAYYGTVVDVSQTVNFDLKAQPYVWVTVRHPRGSKHSWPSNRLG